MIKNKLSFIAIIILVLFLNSLEKLFPTMIYHFFAYPAAFLTSLFFGAPLQWTENHEILIPLAHQNIHIIPSCSGYGFFCLLAGISAWHILRSKNFNVLLGIIAGAYILTILTNSCRMVCAYQAHHAAAIFLPQNFQAAVHQGVGILLFLSVLMTVHLCFERIYHVEYHR